MRTDPERNGSDDVGRAFGCTRRLGLGKHSGRGVPDRGVADISEAPVSEEVAAELQAILDDLAGGAGISATVMTAEGTWSGATGKADGVRDVAVDEQFAIASTTKAIVAAQVMRMVEAGELDLDDPAANHLPPDLDFDTNGATIRQLLGMRSASRSMGWTPTIASRRAR